MKASEIANMVSGELLLNPDIEITDVGKIESAEPNEISFISNPLYAKYFNTTRAGAILISRDFEIKNTRNDVAIIRVKDPYLSFVNIIEHFEEMNKDDFEGVSDLCRIGNDTEIPDDVYIGEYVWIGNNCKIGPKTIIKANSTIGNGVKIGSNCVIEPNVVIYKGCVLGNKVIVHSGTIIGADGFGFVKQEDNRFRKIPQKGIVVVEDDVEIGSNCTIDRATIGETRICRGVKLDNQIQIAHNVFIDEDTVIAAQAGIAGSTRIGKRCMIGGQAGLVGHITLCDDVIVGAAVGVSKSITKPGIYTGYRAKPVKEELRDEAHIKEISKLKERIIELEKLTQTIANKKKK